MFNSNKMLKVDLTLIVKCSALLLIDTWSLLSVIIQSGIFISVQKQPSCEKGCDPQKVVVKKDVKSKVVAKK